MAADQLSLFDLSCKLPVPVGHPEPGFYIYALLDPSKNSKPFYVGKGRGYRYMHHYTPGYVATRSHKSHIIRRYRALGYKDECVFLAKGLTESEAFAVEMAKIAEFGLRKDGGLLVNRTLGGEGMAGCNQPKSPEHRAKISAAHKGKKVSEATLQKMREAGKRRIFTDEHRAKISAALKGRPKSPEHVAAVIEARKKTGISDEWRAELTKRMRSEYVRKCHLEKWARWYDVTFPDGKVERVHNLAAFCRERGLSNQHLGQVALGRRKHHRGFVARFVE